MKKENNEKYPIYHKGTIMRLIDPIDYNEFTTCTIKAIEQDEEDPNLIFYFLYANDDEKNDKFDPRIGRFFEYIERTNPRLQFVAKSTIQ